MSLDATRPFKRDFDSVGDYHDFWVAVYSNAPDDFHYSFLPKRVDQKQALKDAFDSLERGLALVRSKVADERTLGVISALLTMSLGYFRANERKSGIRCMQEAEGMIWPSRAIRLERAADAERLAFGDVQLFKDLPARRFDGEGSISSLGAFQRILFDEAQRRALVFLKDRQSFKPFTLAAKGSGEVFEIKKPSQKKTTDELRRLVEVGEIDAFCRSELVLVGILIHDIEERGKPHISARAPVEDFKVQSFRFFLDDPSIFSL
ncbi:hypothetical protein ACSFA8_23050 [Variovorax sp. RT4R15]|uniref:hypothetical protein n=1 Tax=Variovorax sp. RT4R15 TaxID=3443737 RepID=UPI003F4894D4